MTSPLTATVTMPSGTRVVVVDPWAKNPLVDGFKALNPATYAAPCSMDRRPPCSSPVTCRRSPRPVSTW